MVTKKELFLELKNLLATSIPEVNNRVYSSFPKKKYTLPLIVISNISYEEDSYTLNDSVISGFYSVEIYLYSKTSQEIDELSEKIKDSLRAHDFFGMSKTIRDEGTVDSFEENSIVHESAIELILQW